MVNTRKSSGASSSGSPPLGEVSASPPPPVVEEVWDEDTGEYDVDSHMTVRPIQGVNESTFNDISTEKGFEFETAEEATEAEKDELDARNNYWSREQMVKYLENCPKPDVDICPDSDIYDERFKCMQPVVADGVYKRVMRWGSGEVIKQDMAILYNLNAFLEGQDEPFDSTWLRGRPYLHRLSYDTVLPGVCYALMSMKRGERSEFMVRPKYAYLEMGCPPRVPGNSTILYIIEVIKVFEEGTLAHLDSMTYEERQRLPFDTLLSHCDTERQSANGYFKAERYREAAFRYRRAIRCLEGLTFKSSEENKRSNDLLIKLYVNIANTYNKFGKPLSAMTNCKSALLIDPESSKALYQYGLAKMMNADYGAAERYLKHALRLKPNSPEIKSAIERLDHRMNGEKRVERELYQRMGAAFKSDK